MSSFFYDEENNVQVDEVLDYSLARESIQLRRTAVFETINEGTAVTYYPTRRSLSATIIPSKNDPQHSRSVSLVSHVSLDPQDSPPLASGAAKDNKKQALKCGYGVLDLFYLEFADSQLDIFIHGGKEVLSDDTDWVVRYHATLSPCSEIRSGRCSITLRQHDHTGPVEFDICRQDNGSKFGIWQLSIYEPVPLTFQLREVKKMFGKKSYQFIGADKKTTYAWRVAQDYSTLECVNVSKNFKVARCVVEGGHRMLKIFDRLLRLPEDYQAILGTVLALEAYFKANIKYGRHWSPRFYRNLAAKSAE